MLSFSADPVISLDLTSLSEGFFLLCGQNTRMSRVILILGASSDIAKAIGRLHAEKNDQLILAGRNIVELEKDATDLRIRFGGEVSVKAFDAQEMEQHPTFYQNLPAPPDWVYCVFGYLGDQEEAEQNPQMVRQILEVNYLGAVSIMEEAARQMEKRNAGTLIGISSVAGDRGRASNYFYGSAKAGFTAYLSGLRNRLAKKGVHVLTVKPGFVDTQMTEGLDLPGPLTAQPAKAAQDIVRSAEKKKNVLYTLWLWRYIMLIIRNIPEVIFKKLSL